MNRLTDRQTYQKIEKQLRRCPEYRKVIQQNYSAATPIGQLARCLWNDDKLAVKAQALLAGASLKNWYNVIIGQ